jgi:hypothetical protein
MQQNVRTDSISPERNTIPPRLSTNLWSSALSFEPVKCFESEETTHKQPASTKYQRPRDCFVHALTVQFCLHQLQYAFALFHGFVQCCLVNWKIIKSLHKGTYPHSKPHMRSHIHTDKHQLTCPSPSHRTSNNVLAPPKVLGLSANQNTVMELILAEHGSGRGNACGIPISVPLC